MTVTGHRHAFPPYIFLPLVLQRHFMPVKGKDLSGPRHIDSHLLHGRVKEPSCGWVDFAFCVEISKYKILSLRHRTSVSIIIWKEFSNFCFLGVAYLLSVLNVGTDFDSLHWFQSIRDKYSTELAGVTKQKQMVTKDDEKLLQTLNLTAKRLEIYKRVGF